MGDVLSGVSKWFSRGSVALGFGVDIWETRRERPAASTGQLVTHAAITTGGSGLGAWLLGGLVCTIASAGWCIVAALGGAAGGTWLGDKVADDVVFGDHSGCSLPTAGFAACVQDQSQQLA